MGKIFITSMALKRRMTKARILTREGKECTRCGGVGGWCLDNPNEASEVQVETCGNCKGSGHRPSPVTVP